MWDLIVSVPDHCLFFFLLWSSGVVFLIKSLHIICTAIMDIRTRNCSVEQRRARSTGNISEEHTWHSSVHLIWTITSWSSIKKYKISPVMCVNPIVVLLSRISKRQRNSMVSLGISPVPIDCWKRWANTGPNSVASSFRTLGWSSSGPKALEGFKPLRSLNTPSLETAISFMKGADLSRSGTWVCSFLLNTSVNWPLNSSAFSRSDWATPFPFFLFRGGIPWVSFFWLLMYR